MRLGLNRRNVGRLVLLAWAAALAWLAQRQLYTGEAATVARGASRFAVGASYYAVLAGDRQVGQLNMTVDTLVDGVRLTEIMALDLPLGDSTRQIARSTEYELSRSLRLRGFTTRVFGWGSAEQADQLEARMGEDSILALTRQDGSSEVTGRARYRMPFDAVLPPMLSFRAALGRRLQVGARFGLPLFDPAAGATAPLAVQVTAESTFVVPDSAVWDTTAKAWVPATMDTLRAWRLEHHALGPPIVAWVDAGGALVEAEIAGGIRLKRSAFEMVRNNYRGARDTASQRWRDSLPGMRSLAASRRIPDTTTAVRRFLWRPDSGAVATGLPAAAIGGRQSLAGDTLRVTRLTEPADTASPPPEALYSTVDLPLGSRLIAEAMREALEGATTASDSVRRLTLWVARRIVTDTASSASGSVTVALRTGRGPPDAKARLLTAMARVAKIPARMVNGLVVFPDGAFAHSWTELWLGGWVAADPTFGHYPASTSLIRLSAGGGSGPMYLFPLVASARFLPLRPGS